MSTKPDALLNLADAMAEDILKTPDDEILREVEEDFGDPRALANKFDQILEHAEKQVFGTARSAASPQVRSSVLDLPARLPHETIRWIKGIFDLGSRTSEFLSSLSPRTLAWSATAAAVVILVQAAVITAVVVKEQGSLATPGSLAFEPDAPPRAKVPGADVAVKTLAAEQPPAVAANPPGPPWPAVAATQPAVAEPPVAQANASPMLSDEEIAALVAGGRQLMIAGDIRNARLVLQQAAEAGNATAALELGATYDPIELAKLGVRDGTLPVASIESKALPDIAMARTWYQKAKDLGSTEAQGRLENLAGRDRPKR